MPRPASRPLLRRPLPAPRRLARTDSGSPGTPHSTSTPLRRATPPNPRGRWPTVPLMPNGRAHARRHRYYGPLCDAGSCGPAHAVRGSGRPAQGAPGCSEPRNAQPATGQRRPPSRERHRSRQRPTPPGSIQPPSDPAGDNIAQPSLHGGTTTTGPNRIFPRKPRGPRHPHNRSRAEPTATRRRQGGPTWRSASGGGAPGKPHA